MELLLPDLAIYNIEENEIKPFTWLNPTLGIVISTNPKSDETLFLKSIKRYAEKYNCKLLVEEAEDIKKAEEACKNLASLPYIMGIICLSNYDNPQYMSLSNMIQPLLDLDCMCSQSLGVLMVNDDYLIAPCMAVACLILLDSYKINISKKKVAIIGRNVKVGLPLAEICCKKDAIVTLMRSNRIRDLSGFDIVIVAIGKYESVDDLWWSNKEDLQKCIILDCGIHCVHGKIYGDCHIGSLEYYNCKMTPVPNGISKLTTVILFSKLFNNARLQNDLKQLKGYRNIQSKLVGDGNE